MSDETYECVRCNKQFTDQDIKDACADGWDEPPWLEEEDGPPPDPDEEVLCMECIMLQAEVEAEERKAGWDPNP